VAVFGTAGVKVGGGEARAFWKTIRFSPEEVKRFHETLRSTMLEARVKS
jgi:hypothetical protein